MHGASRIGLCTLVGCSLIVGGWGCTNSRGASGAWPFAKAKNSMPGIETPVERIAKVKELEKKASNAPPAEIERVSNELAHQIQHEKDPLVRQQIIHTLGSYRAPVSGAVLAAGLGDADAQVRIACCEALGRRGGPEAVQELGKVLHSDTNVDVRIAATRALGMTKNSAAVTPLAEALADGDPAIQFRAIAALKSVSGRDYGNDIAAWKQYATGGTPVVKEQSIAERFRKLF